MNAPASIACEPSRQELLDRLSSTASFDVIVIGGGATGLGIAGVIPAFNSISMFAGAFMAWLFAKARPRAAEAYTIPVSSGLIAGESLVGVAIILAIEAIKLM